jgi:hypothetical protein
MDQNFELFLVKQVGPVLEAPINRPEARVVRTWAEEIAQARHARS